MDSNFSGLIKNGGGVAAKIKNPMTVVPPKQYPIHSIAEGILLPRSLFPQIAKIPKRDNTITKINKAIWFSSIAPEETLPSRYTRDIPDIEITIGISTPRMSVIFKSNSFVLHLDAAINITEKIAAINNIAFATLPFSDKDGA